MPGPDGTGQVSPRRLRVDLEWLTIAMDDSSGEAEWFLDLETGAVLLLTDDIRMVLDDVYRELGEDASPSEVGAALAAQGKAEDEVAALLEADAARWDVETRYIAVPRTETKEAYQDMEDFIETVDDPRLQQRLDDAIQGRGAFRRFRGVLEEEPRYLQRWYAFRDAAQRRRALEWLHSLDVEAILEPNSESRSEECGEG